MTLGMVQVPCSQNAAWYLATYELEGLSPFLEEHTVHLDHDMLTYSPHFACMQAEVRAGAEGMGTNSSGPWR